MSPNRVCRADGRGRPASRRPRTQPTFDCYQKPSRRCRVRPFDQGTLRRNRSSPEVGLVSCPVKGIEDLIEQVQRVLWRSVQDFQPGKLLQDPLLNEGQLLLPRVGEASCQSTSRRIRVCLRECSVSGVNPVDPEWVAMRARCILGIVGDSHRLVRPDRRPATHKTSRTSRGCGRGQDGWASISHVSTNTFGSPPATTNATEAQNSFQLGSNAS